MQNLARFCTTSDFDCEYLRNDSRCPKPESQLIENDSSHVRRNKSSELWSTIQETIFRPLGGAAPEIFTCTSTHHKQCPL